MTLTDIIEKYEGLLDSLEEHTQIPSDKKDKVESLTNEITDILETVADENGEEPEDGSSDNEDDNW